MRTMTLLLTVVGGVVAQPLAAQDQRISYSSEDTVVNIRRGGDNDQCTVKIANRELPEREAKVVCDRILARNVINSRLLATQAARIREQTTALRDQVRRLDTVRLSGEARALELQERALAMQRDGLARNMDLYNDSRALSDRAMVDARRAQESAQRGLFSTMLPTMINRAIIGVNIDPRARDTDRWGAYVAAVTPNGPAEKAGLRAGDVITKVDGQSMTSREGVSADEGESLPGVRLIAVVSKLEPGKAVELEYRRDNDNHKTRITPIADRMLTATMVPRDSGRGGVFTMVAPRGGVASTWVPLPDSGFRYSLSAPAIANLDAIREAPAFRGTMTTSGFFSPFSRLELAPLNAKLGAYFGTTEGVLVINVPSEGNLGLEPGDVITAVDGRAVNSPASFHRILRSYESDDTFSLRITRQKQPQTLSAKLP